ncbi:MAG: GNAT family N-acetyltransferase [Rhizobacter sp.]
MRVIESQNLCLEPQTVAHAEAMFVVLSDPAIYEHENQPPASAAGLRERFMALESRRSPDGHQQWLNWVIRLTSGELIGYVQSTVHPDGHAAIAYELHSAYWGRGLASQAVRAMIAELADHYDVVNLSAVLKAGNQRSFRLLERLGFSIASPEAHARHQPEAGELLMERRRHG